MLGVVYNLNKAENLLEEQEQAEGSTAKQLRFNI